MATIPDELTITFKSPITVSDKEFESITLREFTVSEYSTAINRAKGDNFVVIVSLVQQVSGAPMPVINAMKFSDFSKATKYIELFLV